MRSRVVSPVVTVLLVGIGASAIAQEAGQSELQEVVVTAQKRAEKLVDVPVSVAAFSGSELDHSQVNGLRDLQTISPSFIVEQTTDRASAFYFMRGVGDQIQDRGFEQSVGVYIDGIYRGRAGAAMMDLVDVDRIEVLRGPQSTLFGRNNLVGAISVVTQEPSFSFAQWAEATYGNYNITQVKASATGPITDNIAFRLAVLDNSHDGFLKNLYPGADDLDSVNDQSVRGQLLFDFSDSTSLRLIGDYSVARDKCCGLALAFVSDAAASGLLNGYTPPGPGTPGVFPRTGAPGTYYNPFNYTVADNGIHFQNLYDSGLSAEFKHDYGSFTLNALGSYRYYHSLDDTDITWTDNDVLHIPVTVNDSFPEQSAEVRLSNSTPGMIDWVAGVYYFHQHLGEDNSFLAVGVHYNAQQDTNSGAVFGQSTWHVTDKLSLTGGARYLDERRSEVEFGIPPATTLSTNGVVHQDDDAWMPTAVVAYKFDDQTNLYAKYSRGFLAGAINLFISGPAIQQNPSVRPTINDSFELGAKFRLLDNTLSINSAVFHQRIKDEQVQSIIPNTFTFVVMNAAGVISQGVELEADYKPIDRLTLSTGAAYLHAYYSSFPNASAPFGFSAPVEDATGKPTDHAPKVTLTGNLQYEQPLGEINSSLIGRLGGRYASSYYTAGTDPIFIQPASVMLDASLELAKGTRWSLQAWTKNLTDAHIIRGGQQLPTGGVSYGYYLGDPRTYGITARIHF